MLILTRMKGEAIVIGEDIIVTVEEIRSGNRVRLGIQAPRDIEVDRLEVRQAKERGGRPMSRERKEG